MPVHGDRIELAYTLAVRQAQATPGATLASARHEAGRTAGIDAAIIAMPMRYITAPGTGQPGNAFVSRTQVDAEKVCDLLVDVHTINRAGAWFQFVAYQLFGKRAAAGSTTGAAVGVWQHVFDLVNSGILIHIQATIGECQNRSQDQAETDHEHDGEENFSHELRVSV